MKWFLGAILILLIAIVLESGLIAYAMYVLLAVLLISRWLARSWINNLSAGRTCEMTTAEIGEEVSVEVVVKNAGVLPIPWVLLEDILPPDSVEGRTPRLKIKGKRLMLRMIPSRGKVTISYEIKCLIRGYYQLGPLVMESGDLFGLHRRYRVDAAPHFLLVYPRVVPLQGYDLASRRPIGDIRLTHRLFEDPTRIGGVRPYEAGDPLNRVHWRATARTGVLHSKIYEPSSMAGSTILLDFHQAGFPRRGEPDRSELAVTAAVSLANAVYLLGQQVGLVTNARDAVDRIRREGWKVDYHSRFAAHDKNTMRAESHRLEPVIVETRRGVEQFQRIRETLARVELTDGLTVPQLLAESAARLPRDATVVALLPEVAEETAMALGNLRRQGFAVAAILIIPHEDEMPKYFGRLWAQGIMDVRTLNNEQELPELCSQQMQRTTAYRVQI